MAAKTKLRKPSNMGGEIYKKNMLNFRKIKMAVVILCSAGALCDFIPPEEWHATTSVN